MSGHNMTQFGSELIQEVRADDASPEWACKEKDYFSKMNYYFTIMTLARSCARCCCLHTASKNSQDH